MRLILPIENVVRTEVERCLGHIFYEGNYKLSGIAVDWVDGEIEISGYDGFKEEEFTVFYNQFTMRGRVHYYDGDIKPFEMRPYGGIRTDVTKLPVGTKFYVNNGGWQGEITYVLRNKYITGDACINLETYPEGYELDITILE